MATVEPMMNDALAHLLRFTRRAWRDNNVVSSENTGMLVGSNKRPNILVCEPTVSPVAIETEVLPAATVEREAIEQHDDEQDASHGCDHSYECFRVSGKSGLGAWRTIESAVCRRASLIGHANEERCPG